MALNKEIRASGFLLIVFFFGWIPLTLFKALPANRKNHRIEVTLSFCFVSMDDVIVSNSLQCFQNECTANELEQKRFWWLQSQRHHWPWHNHDMQSNTNIFKTLVTAVSSFSSYNERRHKKQYYKADITMPQSLSNNQNKWRPITVTFQLSCGYYMG